MLRRLPVLLALAAFAAALPADALASPAWLAPFDLAGAGGYALEQHAAFDDHGEAFAIWRRRVGAGDFIVQVAIRQPGGAVTVQDVSSPGQSAYEPDLAVDPNGNAVATWIRTDGAQYRVQAAVRPPGGSFGAPQTLSPAGQNARGPQAAVDAAGGAAVVWERNDDPPLSGSTFQGAQRAPGGAFGAAKNLSTPTNGVYAGWGDVDMDPAGDAVAVWEQGPFPSPKKIQASFRAAGGDFGAPQSLTDPAVVTTRNPHVGMDAGGGAVLEWAQAPLNSNQDRVEAAVRPPGGIFGSAQPVSRASEDANGVDLAVNSRGEAIVAWESNVPVSKIRVEAARRPAGGSFGGVQDLSSTDGDPQRIQAAVDEAGEALAVWRRTDAKQVIVGASAEAGAPFGAAAPISSPGDNVDNPAVALSSRGDGLAVWQSPAGADGLVQGAGFDARGPCSRASPARARRSPARPPRSRSTPATCGRR